MAISTLALAGLGVVLITLAVLVFILVWKIAKELFSKVIVLVLNSLAGLIILLTLNLLFKIDLPINAITLVVSGVFGLAGIGTLVLLKLGGMI
jgi:pro-sigmaK processing inhibitor BofA